MMHKLVRKLKVPFYTFAFFAVAISFTSCREKGCTDVLAINYSETARKDDGSCIFDEMLGEITVDINASKVRIRTREALAGNLICDALLDYAMNVEGKNVDFAMVNGGGIRFNIEKRDSIFNAGIWKKSMVEELIPFGNTITIVTLSGEELISVLERSASSLPGDGPQFLQFSNQMNLTIDTTKTAQILDETNPDYPTISINGQRATTVLISGVSIDSTASYKIVTSSFIASGMDGYVTLGNLSSEDREDFTTDFVEVVSDYIRQNSPLTPVLNQRIVIQ